MNSWDIIKAELTCKSSPGTLGRSIAVNQCAELYVRLMHNLTDHDAATKAMNDDDELREALVNRKGIAELREAKVIQ